MLNLCCVVVSNSCQGYQRLISPYFSLRYLYVGQKIGEEKKENYQQILRSSINSYFSRNLVKLLTCFVLNCNSLVRESK